MSNPFLRNVSYTELSGTRSLKLRGNSSIVTVTVQWLGEASAEEKHHTLGERIRGAIFRVLTRAVQLETRRLQPAELPPQLLVLSHYQQALQGFPGDEQLADAVGVRPAEVEQWKSGQVPSNEKLRRLRDLATVVVRLVEYYTPAAIPDWLYGQNPDLGGRRPVELLREGNLADVLSAAEAQTSGAYI